MKGSRSEHESGDKNHLYGFIRISHTNQMFQLHCLSNGTVQNRHVTVAMMAWVIVPSVLRFVLLSVQL